jgi:hypothetical protein
MLLHHTFEPFPRPTCPIVLLQSRVFGAEVENWDNLGQIRISVLQYSGLLHLLATLVRLPPCPTLTFSCYHSTFDHVPTSDDAHIWLWVVAFRRPNWVVAVGFLFGLYYALQVFLPPF